jgi:hypothetical protein
LQLVQTHNKEDFDEVTGVEEDFLRSQLKKPEIEGRPLRRKKYGFRVPDGSGASRKVAKEMTLYTNMYNLLLKRCFFVSLYLSEIR